MTKYFITSDVHGFYSILKKELDKQGFDINNPEHILVIIGDAFDRGQEAKKLLNYLTKLKKLNKLIYIRGNHESCMEKLLTQLQKHKPISLYHLHNKTLDTLSQLTGISQFDLMCDYYNYEKDIIPKMKKYLKLTKDLPYYYEIGDYILTHGYIPINVKTMSQLKKVSKQAWESAMWFNGMQQWHLGQRIKGKTIVVGHFHTSFGNYLYHNLGSGEFENDSVFSPFIDKQIIALDACTAWTSKINIVIMEVNIL